MERGRKKLCKELSVAAFDGDVWSFAMFGVCWKMVKTQLALRWVRFYFKVSSIAIIYPSLLQSALLDFAMICDCEKLEESHWMLGISGTRGALFNMGYGYNNKLD